MKRFETSVAGIDEHLIDKAAAGDFAAFQELTTRFQSRVFRVALRIVGQQQDAKDLTQQTFLSLIEHVDSFRGESSVATWLLRSILACQRGVEKNAVSSMKRDSLRVF